MEGAPGRWMRARRRAPSARHARARARARTLRLSFWMVPVRLASGAPCSSAATMYMASTGSTCAAAAGIARTDGGGSGAQGSWRSRAPARTRRPPTHGAVHGHRHGRRGQRDAVKERLHVLNRVDGHAGHADVAFHARVVRVVAAVRGEVKGHAQALLARRQVRAVKGVGLRRRGKARVLAHRPRPRRVHARAHATRVRVLARQRRRLGHVRRRVHGLDRNALGRRPDQRRRGLAAQLRARRRRPGLGQRHGGRRGRRRRRATEARRQTHGAAHDGGEATQPASKERTKKKKRPKYTALPEKNTCR